MEKSISSLKLEDATRYFRENQTRSKCEECGQEFDKPIHATVSSGYIVEEYYACPRCLTKVGEVEGRNSKEDRDDQSEEKGVKIEMEKTVEESTCDHYVGYLRKRPKSTPIPEECLTCNRMIECLAY
jgi:DNA-directed RNA polymerase subunit RPC12/RpoP